MTSFQRPIRVIVTGAGGMLGSDLVEAFRGAGHLTEAMSRENLDITRKDDCFTVVESFRPQVVVNTAALTAVDYCESHAEEAFLVNGDGAGYIALAARQAGAVIVHFSTDYVFDGLARNAYSEEDAPNPICIYGRSKWRGEELVREAGSDHLILRTSWLFGRNGRNFVRTIARAARAGESLRVVNDQRGCPSYTKDLASHTVLIIEADHRGTYHLTNSGDCSWHELAVHILRCIGEDPSRVAAVSTCEFPRPAPRPANSVLANARLEHESLPKMRSWQEAVSEYLEDESAWATS